MKRTKKGFTLAELLIVVAIIAVLVAIAIPIFNAQLEKSREATDAANIRDAYAEISVGLLDGGFENTTNTMTISGGMSAVLANTTDGFTVTLTGIKLNQTQSDWQGATPVVAGYQLLAADATEGAVGRAGQVVYTFKTVKNATNGASNTYLEKIAITNA